MKISSKKIFQLKSDWENYMQESWDRGMDNVDFVEKSQQIVGDSSNPDFEMLTFNWCVKFLKTAQSRAQDIDLTLSLKSHCDVSQETEKTYKRLLSHIMLNEQNKRAFTESLKKVYAFGQSVLHVKPVRESEATLNEGLTVENVQDVKSVFFDRYSSMPDFSDGSFCGRTFKMSAKKVRKYYKNIRQDMTLPTVCTIADFWHKEKKTTSYVKLSTGEYKQEDLITDSDNVVIGAPVKKGMKTILSYYRVIDGWDGFLEKEKNLNFPVLPLIFNSGGVIWDSRLGKYETYPFLWHLRDPQRLLNYTVSIMAEVMKSTTADKWIFSVEHVCTPSGKTNAEQIGIRSGGLTFPGDTSKIQHHPSQQIPPALAQVFTQLQQAMQSLAGSYFEENAGQIKNLSGVALDKLFNRMDLTQNPVILAHISALNRVGEAIKHMIPAYYYQERVICVKSDDGNQIPVKINIREPQPNGMTIVVNNVKDLNSLYTYEIEAAPSKRLQKQNTQTELSQLYQIYPPAAQSTIDLYAASLDIPIAEQLSKRLGINIPDQLKKYSKGEITSTQYQQFAQQQEMQKQQQMMQSPQVQNIQAMTASEMAKAHAATAKPQIDAFKAQTERLKEESMADNKHIEVIAGANKVAMENANTQHAQQIRLAEKLIEHANVEKDLIE